MFVALSVKTIGDQVGPHDTGVLMDPCCFLEQHNNHAAVMVQMQKELIDLKSGQNIIIHNQEMILKNQKNILHNQAMIMRKITSVSTDINMEDDDVGVLGSFHLDGEEVLVTPDAKFSKFFYITKRIHQQRYSQHGSHMKFQKNMSLNLNQMIIRITMKMIEEILGIALQKYNLSLVACFCIMINIQIESHYKYKI